MKHVNPLQGRCIVVNHLLCLGIDEYRFSTNCSSEKEWAALANIMSVHTISRHDRSEEIRAHIKMWRRIVKDLKAFLAEKAEGITIKPDDERNVHYSQASELNGNSRSLVDPKDRIINYMLCIIDPLIMKSGSEV